jgi:hypothetical protein
MNVTLLATHRVILLEPQLFCIRSLSDVTVLLGRTIYDHLHRSRPEQSSMYSSEDTFRFFLA